MSDQSIVRPVPLGRSDASREQSTEQLQGGLGACVDGSW